MREFKMLSRVSRLAPTTFLSLSVRAVAERLSTELFTRYSTSPRAETSPHLGREGGRERWGNIPRSELPDSRSHWYHSRQNCPTAQMAAFLIPS